MLTRAAMGASERARRTASMKGRSIATRRLRSGGLSVGIRPEGVLVSHEAAPGYVPLEAHIIEPLGSHDIVDLQVGEGMIRARTPSGFVPKVGERVHARIDPAQAHFFDTASGKSLGIRL